MRLRHWILLGLVVAGSLVAEQFVHHEHEYWFTPIPGYFVLYGFVGCVAIIMFAKALGRSLVNRPEDYYRDHGDPDPHLARTGVADPGSRDEPTEPEDRSEGGPG
jgi:hypothetical protein